jgi:hypothetical protein
MNSSGNLVYVLTAGTGGADSGQLDLDKRYGNSGRYLQTIFKWHGLPCGGLDWLEQTIGV